MYIIAFEFLEMDEFIYYFSWKNGQNLTFGDEDFGDFAKLKDIL